MRENDRKNDKLANLKKSNLTLLVFAWHSPHTHLIIGPNDFLAMEKKVWVLSDEKTEILTEKNDQIDAKTSGFRLAFTPYTLDSFP